MKALVIGLGISGKAAAGLLKKLGAEVTGVDKRDVELDGVRVLREDVLSDLSAFDLVVLSPGVSPNHPLCLEARRLNIELIGEMELACRYLKQPAIGITGTNGKTTVTLMVEHLLRHIGIAARAVGNVGAPLSSQENWLPEEIAVVEVSSFQLETMQTPIFDQALILNISADHLDRHGTLQGVAEAKFRLQNCLKPDGLFHLSEEIVNSWRHLAQRDIEIFDKFGYREDSGHDRENQLAAWALCSKLGMTQDDFSRGLLSFEKPRHRLQFVRELAGVSFYNDSKATNIVATVKAVESIKKDIILLAGGFDKGLLYIAWKKAFEGRVKSVLAFGQTAPKICATLEQIVDTEEFATLDDALEFSCKIAKPGDTVLLSPGCSSFDQFRDYAHRGEEFIKAVNNLSLIGEKV